MRSNRKAIALNVIAGKEKTIALPERPNNTDEIKRLCFIQCRNAAQAVACTNTENNTTRLVAIAWWKG